MSAPNSEKEDKQFLCDSFGVTPEELEVMLEDIARGATEVFDHLRAVLPKSVVGEIEGAWLESVTRNASEGLRGGNDLDGE